MDESGDLDCGTTSNDIAGKLAPAALRSRSSSRDWIAFCQFFLNCRPPLNPSRCSGGDVVKFLRHIRRLGGGTVKIHRLGCQFYGDPNPLAGCACMSYQFSGSIEYIVARLGADFAKDAGRPVENPFHSTAVKAYLKEASREIATEKTKLKLNTLEVVESAKQRVDDLLLPRVPTHGGRASNVFVSFYNHGRIGNSWEDADEARFATYILRELHHRRVFPYTYSLIRTELGNVEILHRCGAAIVIFSKNYACCAKCLDELVMIIDRWKADGLALIPVFFNTTRSQVRDQKGRFGEVFSWVADTAEAHQVQKWRTAMAEAASISGYEWARGSQAILVEEIVRNVCLRLDSNDSKNLIGIDFQLQRIMSLLDSLQPSDIHIVGIWGAAGIGKTTIAREIFSRIAHQYDSCYFVQDFHLMCQRKGLGHLRDDFVSTIFGGEKLGISACDIKLCFMRDRFRRKRVLVVLDDVRNARDAEILLGGFGWFCPGHTIILTSRNRQVLVQCKVKELHEVRKLDEPESFRLFLQYAGKQNLKGKALTSEQVNYANGIPLALIVLGSSVNEKEINNWNEHLKRLWQHPPTEILDAFRRSFDVLDENEKSIFLDLACFFRGETKDHVIKILDGCGFFTDLGIFGLIDESFISILYNRVEMHNIIQDMGRFVVCEEDKEPGKRSRLWDPDDICNVLSENSGTEAIEGISLDASNMKLELHPAVFVRMYRLRLLKFYCSTSNQFEVCLPQGLESFPEELRLLHWESYPLKSLPRNFNPKNLVELNMPFCKIEKLWKGTKVMLIYDSISYMHELLSGHVVTHFSNSCCKQNLEKLKIMRLSHSRRLIKIPRLSKAWNLEHIDLEGCTSLVKVSSSVCYLEKLIFLNLKDCSNLQSLPATVHLESLEVLNLSGCSKLEDIRDFSRNLKELYLAGTAIREVSSSIENLTKLVTLDLENCKRLEHLPMEISNLNSLIELKLSGCSKLVSLLKHEALFRKGSQHLNLTRTAMQESAPSISLHPATQGHEPKNASESLSLQVRSGIQDICLEDIHMDYPPSPFECPTIQETYQPYWSWSTFILSSPGQLPLSILHSLASKLHFLVFLFLVNARLQDIAEEICHLPSLKTLDLGGNDFSGIPESIKELSKLQMLRLGCCRNLKSLSELPGSLEVLDAHACQSLKSILWFSEKIPGHYIFSNCFKLSPLVVQEFFTEALISLVHMSKQRQQEFIKAPAFSICLPTSASPISTTYLRAGSSVEIHLNPSLRKTLLGFTISIVVAFWGDYREAAGFAIRCICRWKTQGGLSWSLERIFHCWASREAVPEVRKDHMFVFWDLVRHVGADEGNYADIPVDDGCEVEFEFNPVNEQNELLHYGCRVKKCGVNVITAPTGDTSVNTKRPLSSLDPRELSYDKDIVQPYKRARIKKIIDSVISEIRKRKKEQILSRARNLEKNLDKCGKRF